MIIKNLWIISSIGMCYYHYRASFSDYDIEDSLFSGLVAGLSIFAESLTEKQKSLEYLKMQEDELYFESIGEIIVAAIITGDDKKLDTFSIKLMMQFIGQKFTDIYQDQLNDLLFDWEEVQDSFLEEIQAFIQDKALLADIKREQFQNLFTQVISGDLHVELLYWKGIQLFSDFPQDALEESLKVLSSLKDVTPTLIDNAFLKAKIIDVLRRLIKDLRSNILPKEPKKLLILCESTDIFQLLYKIFLPINIFSIHCPNFEDLSKLLLETCSNPQPYDILIIDKTISTREIKTIHNLDIKTDVKILIVVSKIPRPPKGRLAYRRPISFVIHNGVTELYKNNPLIDYLQNYFSDEN